MSDIWLPGVGVVPMEVRAAQQAIEQYDEKLELGFNERNQEWVVLWKDGPGGAPYPVLGLGQRLPGYDEIQKMLYRADTVRHGGKIVKDIERRNEAHKAAGRAELSDRAGEVAETLEHAFRRMGKTSYQKVYIPKGL